MITLARFALIELAATAVFVMSVGAAAEPSRSQRLIGTPVFTADGSVIGRVADVSTTADDQIDALRVRTGAVLGFGERLVVIPRLAFTIRRGAVVLPDLTAEDVGAFPSASDQSDSSPSDEGK